MIDLDVEGALGMAERLRAAVAAQKIPFAGESEPLTITASFGVAPLDASGTIETSIDRADKALYQAKAAGRNRVEAWQA
jgi:diguanylate cyclase (GGDEF)-like protein